MDNIATPVETVHRPVKYGMPPRGYLCTHVAQTLNSGSTEYPCKRSVLHSPSEAFFITFHPPRIQALAFSSTLQVSPQLLPSWTADALENVPPVRGGVRGSRFGSRSYSSLFDSISPPVGNFHNNLCLPRRNCYFLLRNTRARRYIFHDFTSLHIFICICEKFLTDWLTFQGLDNTYTENRLQRLFSPSRNSN